MGWQNGPPHLIVQLHRLAAPLRGVPSQGRRQSADLAAAVLDAGDLERGFAWAWLESRQDPILRARMNP